MKYVDYLLQRINIIKDKHIIDFPMTLESIERLRKNKQEDFYEHMLKEKEMLDMSMKESFRQRDERKRKEKKKKEKKKND